MEYFVILSLELPGRGSVTLDTTITAVEGVTRARVLKDMWRLATGKCGSEWANATVVLFNVEPNVLSVSRLCGSVRRRRVRGWKT